MDFLKEMSDIHSFVVLQEIFETWIKDCVINEKIYELEIGYTSLITYPSIYLRKDSAKEEIAAAKACHDILMTYAKDAILKEQASGDAQTKLAATILTLPPEKYILTVCSEFFHLNYFLKALYGNFSEEQLANVNGDDYAKVWLNIFSKGYHFNPTEKEINTDRNHLNETFILISKMNLSSQYKEKMNEENIKPQFEKYYHIENSGSGCMVSMTILIIISITFACLF